MGARAHWLVLALSVALFSLNAGRFWGFTTDDSFISLRYAQNLADGYGPNWNRTGERAEGYTSFLWVALLAVPHLLRADALLVAKVLGLAAMLGAMLVALSLALSLYSTGSRLHGWRCGSLAVLAIAVQISTAVHAVSAMETAVAALLLTTFFLCCVRSACAPTPPTFALTAITGLLYGLTRPEGNFAVVAGFVVLLLVIGRDARSGLAKVATGLYALPGLVYFAWRVLYYGHALPLPFYVKMEHVAPLAGAVTVAGFVGTLAVSALGPLLLVGLLSLRRCAAPVLVSGVCLLMFFLFSEHIMGYFYRFLFPLTPAICVLVAGGGGDRVVGTRSARAAFRTRGAMGGIGGAGSAAQCASGFGREQLVAVGLRRRDACCAHTLRSVPRGLWAGKGATGRSG